jgi:hypothetical protein
LTKFGLGISVDRQCSGSIPSTFVITPASACWAQRKKRQIRLFPFVLLFIFPGLTFAQGGACPAGLPVSGNHCYFIAANGNDGNSGTSESSPWLHSPGMQTCTGNCAAVKPSGGSGFIFRGGDTWHFGNSGAVPYAGVVSTCADNGQTSGGLCLDNLQAASGSPIYYGVDKNWYSGSLWTRPVLTADNSPCNSGTIGTMPDGSTCSNGTDPTGNGQPTYVVNACAYQVGGNNTLVDIGFSKYVYFDNFELTGLCMKNPGQFDGNDTYISYGGDQGPIYITNNYIHGDSHVQYAYANSSPNCTSSTVCMNLYAFNGKVIVGTVGETIENNVVDFSDSDPAGTGICYPGTGFYNVAYNVFRYSSQCIPVNLHVFHDNLYEYYYENGHSNLLEDAETSPIGAIYDNIFRHLYGKLVFWPGPTGSSDSSYFFNNLVYDVSTSQYFDYGNIGVGTDSGQYFVFNNTFQSNGSNSTVIACSASHNTFKNTNNQFIDDAAPFPSSCSGMTNTTPVSMSNSAATTAGFTSTQSFAYSPTASTRPTVGVGTNEYSGYCSTLTGSGDALIQAAGKACQSDTTYACTYDTTSHSVSCPARSPNQRPASAAWDVGAFQFSSQGTLGIPQNLSGTLK